MPPALEPADVYDTRCLRFAEERDTLARESNRISNVRLLVFTTAVACSGWALWSETVVIGVAAMLLLAGFVLLVIRHRRLDRARRRAEGLHGINAEAHKRLDRAWASLPLRHTVSADSSHPYATDLDLFGRASLFQLLESVVTRMGERVLSHWLLAPAPPATVRERQVGVAELAPLIELRQELAWRGRPFAEAGPDPDPFLDWAESDPWLTRRRGLLWAARINPPLLWLALAAELVGVTPVPIWPLFVGINLLLGWALVGPSARTLARVAAVEGHLGAYANALELLASASFDAPVLRRLQARLNADGLAAPAQIRRLQRLTALAFPSSSMLYAAVQVVTLWDIHVLAALERWQAAVGPRARDWLTVLGEAEAITALAVLAHDHPDWAFPVFDPAADAIEASGLGHPLLSTAARVVNDVTIGPPGTFLLVTGSNMSGKSTLLRAVGVNVVLAGAGGPVCAARLRLPPVRLWTSMRIQDSLERGVSFFMAELERLKQVVDASRANGRVGAEAELRLLYLLDEILQGTNSAERQVAARRIIRRLIDEGAIGAVSTHDLALADAGPLAPAGQAVHFTEQVSDDGGGPRMSFDYKLRPGIATTTNALRLMELVGLPSE